MQIGRERCALFLLTIALTLFAAGCAGDEKNRAELKAGYQSLDQRQYDQAVTQADNYLRRTPHGAGSAEALYLKGRALEAKASPGGGSANPDADWQAARVAYVEALGQKPARDLEAHIRAGVANVAYWQNDYATAQQQWKSAYDLLDDPGLKGRILYRIGLCQQRLGHFDDADRTFADVEKQYPNTEPAQWSAEHKGARAFYVQLATFANPAGADKAAAEARGMGVVVQRMTDVKGRQVLRVGPIATYAEARATKSRVEAQFPDALIVP